MSEPKITFADEPQATLINGLRLTVSPATSDILAAVHFGHTQAIEMFKTVTRPPEPSPSRVVFPDQAQEEEELGPGIIDMRSVAGMSPVAREAFLSAHGLQVASPGPVVEDETHKVMTEMTGVKVPVEGEDEDEDE